MSTKKGTARLVAWLTGTIVGIVTLVLPLGYYFLARQYMLGSLETDARLSARAITQIISVNPGMWEFRHTSLREYLVHHPEDGSPETRRIVNRRGEVVAESATALEPPVVMRSFDVLDSGVVVGRIEIYRSLRPFLVRAGLVLILVLPLGIGAFAILQVMPIRGMRRAEEALRETEETYRTLIEPATVGILVADADSQTFRQVNRTAEELRDARNSEILGNHAAPAVEQARLYEELRHSAAHLEVVVEERTRELQAANAKLREATRRAEEASRRKSAFLADMSHEIRTPLNAVIGFSELLQGQGMGPLNEKQARYVSHILKSGRHLHQLIGDILDLSKVEAGKVVLQPQPLAAAAALEDVLVIIRGLANKKGQIVEADVESSLPILTADPVRFKQICFNLLSNAVKYTPERGRIRLVARRVNGMNRLPVDSAGPRGAAKTPALETDGDFLEIRVSDTGMGIKAENLPRLFQEFVRLEAETRNGEEGTGLGLSLAKKLVDLHGGRIWAESEGEGRGSTFAVTLPFRGPRTPGPTYE